MRTLLIIVLLFPLPVLAVDNMMINSEVKEIAFSETPAIGMSFVPGIDPGVVVSLPYGPNTVLSGYRVRSKGIKYIVGISCEADLTDDCSDYPYVGDYQQRTVYVRYIQTSDRKFRTPEGAGTGERWDRAIQRVGADKAVYSANDSCMLLPSGWFACIDLMSVNREFDLKTRRLMPRKTAILDFFYKSKNGK